MKNLCTGRLSGCWLVVLIFRYPATKSYFFCGVDDGERKLVVKGKQKKNVSVAFQLDSMIERLVLPAMSQNGSEACDSLQYLLASPRARV